MIGLECECVGAKDAVIELFEAKLQATLEGVRLVRVRAGNSVGVGAAICRIVAIARVVTVPNSLLQERVVELNQTCQGRKVSAALRRIGLEVVIQVLDC